MTRNRWTLVLVLLVGDVLLTAWTVHLQLTWRAVPGGPRVMPATQLLRWALCLACLLYTSDAADE